MSPESLLYMTSNRLVGLLTDSLGKLCTVVVCIRLKLEILVDRSLNSCDGILGSETFLHIDLNTADIADPGMYS